MQNSQMTYVGFTTKDFRERIEEHSRGLTKTTTPNIPWKIEVVVTFHDRQKAEQFEKYLKGGSGYAFAKGTSVESQFCGASDQKDRRIGHTKLAQ